MTWPAQLYKRVLGTRAYLLTFDQSYVCSQYFCLNWISLWCVIQLLFKSLFYSDFSTAPGVSSLTRVWFQINCPGAVWFCSLNTFSTFFFQLGQTQVDLFAPRGTMPSVMSLSLVSNPLKGFKVDMFPINWVGMKKYACPSHIILNKLQINSKWHICSPLENKFVCCSVVIIKGNDWYILRRYIRWIIPCLSFSYRSSPNVSMIALSHFHSEMF